MTLTNILLIKMARFAIGLVITFLAIILGIWHGRKLSVQGFTGENYFPKSELDRFAVLRLIIISVVACGTLIGLDRYSMALNDLGPYLTQFSMITLRSVLGFFLAFQWQIWEDRKRLRQTLPIVVLAVLILTGIELFVLAPSALFVSSEVGPDGVIMQSTGTTCGPCSLANILRLYNRPVHEKDVTLAMETGMGGASNAEMEKGARMLGFPQAKAWRGTLEEMAAQNQPMLVNIQPEDMKTPHAVALVGVSTLSVAILDSLVGVTLYTRKDFLVRWLGDGVLLGSPSFPVNEAVSLQTFDTNAFKRRSLAMEAH